MAAHPSTMLEWYHRLYRGRFGEARAVLEAHLERMDRIVAELKASPLSGQIRLFGSAVTAPGMVPGDIDVLVEGPYPVPAEERDAELRRLLAVGVARVGGEYGRLDAVRLVRPKGRPPVLAAATEDGDGRWAEADGRTAAALLGAGRAGVAVAGFARVFREEFAAALEPAARAAGMRG